MAEKSQKNGETLLFCGILSVLTNRNYRLPRSVVGPSIVQHPEAQSSLQQLQQLIAPTSLQITSYFSRVFEQRSSRTLTCLPNGWHPTKSRR
jgi:hypothetical protein